MNRRRAGADVGAVVDAGERIDGVLSEEPLLCRKLYSVLCRLLEGNLVVTHRAIDIEEDAAGILANGLGLLFGQRDVALDDLHRALGDGPFLLPFERRENGG